MREYKELLGLVSKMDSGTEKRTVSYVRMDVVSGEPMTFEPRSYSQLLEDLSPADTFAQMSVRQQKKQQSQQAQKQVQAQRQVEFPAPAQEPEEEKKSQGWSLGRQQKQADQGKWTIPSFPSLEIPKATLPSPIETRAPKQGWSVPVFKKPHLNRPAAQPEQAKHYNYTSVQKPSTAPLAQAAAEELSRVVKASEIPVQQVQQQAQVRPSSSLVLPNLSITDQVTELDKIIQNLKNSSFTPDQMQIVKEEVTGLAKSLVSQQTVPAEGIEKDMFELRTTRLAEALSLIRGI